MPTQEIPLPVGAKNLSPAFSTFNRSGNDGDIPIVKVFTGDNFVGEVIDGHWIEYWSGSNEEYFLLDGSGTLSITLDGGTSTLNALKSYAQIPVLQDGYIDIHLEVETSTPSNNVEATFSLTEGFPSGVVTAEEHSLTVKLIRTTTPTYEITVVKYVEGTPTTIYVAAAVTNEEGTFRIKFRPDDAEIDIYYHDGAGAVVESSDELTLTSDDLDMFPLGVVNPTIGIYTTTTGGQPRVIESDGITVSTPDFIVGYEQDAADYGKGDVKIYDTMASATESDWRRVYNESHVFTGDCVIENGLIRLIVDEAAQYGFELYFWDGAAWTQPADRIITYQETDAKELSYTYINSIQNITRADSVTLRAKVCSTASNTDDYNAIYDIKLGRGNYHLTYNIVSVTPQQEISFRVYDSTNLRFQYCGLGTLAGLTDLTDNDWAATVTNTAMVHNYLIAFDEAGSDVLLFLAANKKPTSFYSSSAQYISLEEIVTADFDDIDIILGLCPFDVSVLFHEAESGTTTGTDDVVDAGASGGYCVELDAEDEYVYVDTGNGLVLTHGKYLVVIRAKDTNQVSNDCHFRATVYGFSGESSLNEQGSNYDYNPTLTSSYALYGGIFDVRPEHHGETFRIWIHKNTATANTISIDYMLVIPLGEGESWPQDIASNAMREANVNFRLTDSATYALFSGLGLVGQLAGSVYTDAMAINAIESAASIDLTGSFSASTIKTAADNEGIYVGAGDDLRLYHDGTDTYIQNQNGQMILKCIGDDVVIDAVDSFIDISGEFYIRDKGDANVILAELDTVARTLQFGQSADKLTIDLYGDLTISDYLTIDIINHETTDVDKFLVSNAGVIKYRTGDELVIDIGAASVPLALTDLASYTQGSIVIGGGADWEPLVAGTEDYVLKMGTDEPAWGQVDYSELAGTQPAPINHNLVDTAKHPVTGLTPGHFLKALTSTTYGFATVPGGTDYDPDLAIGSGNATWIACIWESASVHTSFRGETLGRILPQGNTYLTFSVPLPTNRGGKTLRISATRVSLFDADGSNFVNETQLKGTTDTSVTNLDTDPTNKNSPALWYNSFGAENLGVYHTARVLLGCAVATPGQLSINFVSVRYYYA